MAAAEPGAGGGRLAGRALGQGEGEKDLDGTWFSTLKGSPGPEGGRKARPVPSLL